jgi:pSer/pThr/pTyr-binding forkhead associated (FHA) protein
MQIFLQPEGTQTRSVRVTEDLLVVGRASWCDLRIVHKSISKCHCALVMTDQVVVLRDLGSTNGTRVNGQRVRRGTLLPNDIISFANFRYKLVYTNDTEQGGSTGESKYEPFPDSDAGAGDPALQSPPPAPPQ